MTKRETYWEFNKKKLRKTLNFTIRVSRKIGEKLKLGFM